MPNKRKPKRPKAMRVTTEASTAKLPKPRKRKPTWAEGHAKWEAKVRKAFDDARDSLTERNGGPTPRAIPLPASPIAGQQIDGIGSAPLDVPRAIPCGEDVYPTSTHATYQRINVIGVSFDGADGRTYTIQEQGIGVEWTPPVTSAYPWGLKFAWWLDGVPTRVRRWLAARLRWLAGKVEP